MFTQRTSQLPSMKSHLSRKNMWKKERQGNTQRWDLLARRVFRWSEVHVGKTGVVSLPQPPGYSGGVRWCRACITTGSVCASQSLSLLAVGLYVPYRSGCSPSFWLSLLPAPCAEPGLPDSPQELRAKPRQHRCHLAGNPEALRPREAQTPGLLCKGDLSPLRKRGAEINCLLAFLPRPPFPPPPSPPPPHTHPIHPAGR